MRAALNQAHSKSEIHVYPHADHGFLADYRPTYNKEAAEDGWQRLRAWRPGVSIEGRPLTVRATDRPG